MDAAITLKIAGLNVQIRSRSRKTISYLSDYWGKFITPEAPDWTVLLEMKKSMSGEQHAAALPPWDQKQFQIRDRRIVIKGDAVSRAIEVAAVARLGWGVILRCVASVLFVYLGGILLHGAAFLEEEGVRVFFGPSGRGKSTLSKLGLQKGKILLTDESTAILPKGDRYWAWATPFYGELSYVSENSGGPLISAVLLHHAGENKLMPIPFKKLFQNLMSNAFFITENRYAVEKLFDNIQLIAQQVEGFELHFVPDGSVWRFIDEHIRICANAPAGYRLARYCR